MLARFLKLKNTVIFKSLVAYGKSKIGVSSKAWSNSRIKVQRQFCKPYNYFILHTEF